MSSYRIHSECSLKMDRYHILSSHPTVLILSCLLISMLINVSPAFTQNNAPNNVNRVAQKQVDPNGLCGFAELRARYLKSQIQMTQPSREYLLSRGKIDVLGQSIPDQIDQQVDFWTYDLYNKTLEKIHATCRAIGENCYIYVDNAESIDDAVVENIKYEFDTHIYPTDRTHFGSEWKPGIDGDDKITILIYNIKDAQYYGQASWYTGGYFNPLDETQGGYSNEREMIYADCNPAVPGNNSFYYMLAHEFQHMIHWNEDRDEELWINEGCSEYAGFICGYGVRPPERFFADPNNSLTEWNGDLSDYEKCFLWILYMSEKYGGASTITQLVKEGGNGIQGIENILQVPFHTIFSNWIVANYLDDVSVENGQYGYQNIDLSSYAMTCDQIHDSYPVSSSGSVNRWASEYIKFTDGHDVTFTYNGPASARLIETGVSIITLSPFRQRKESRILVFCTIRSFWLPMGIKMEGIMTILQYLKILFVLI